MNLRKSKTGKNLQDALNQELRAHFEYIVAADAAQASGHDLVADIFFQTAENEMEHARQERAFMAEEKDVETHLSEAIAHEIEATSFYRKASQEAANEGFAEVADFFARIAGVEDEHCAKFREILADLKEGRSLKGRTVRHSAVTMAQLMLPEQANPAGFVHGGELMKMMDNAAGVAAARHSHTNVVTALVSEINFIRPVKVGALVIINARITFVHRSSMEVRAEVDTEDIGEEKRTRALTAYYTMVSVDDSGRPLEVPPLIVYTEEEQRLQKEGLERYEARKKRKQKSHAHDSDRS